MAAFLISVVWFWAAAEWHLSGIAELLAKQYKQLAQST